MKSTFFVFLFLFLHGMVIDSCIAQEKKNPAVMKGPLVSYIPFFADDIIINSQPSQNQRNLAMCSAFNGWLYAVYTHGVGEVTYTTFTRSIDNGMTWEILMDAPLLPIHWIPKKIQIMATGNSISDLKVFFAHVDKDTVGDLGGAAVIRFTGEPFALEHDILNETSYYVTDLAMANDNLFPSTGSNPNSIAILYSKRAPSDSLVFLSSGNNGQQMDNRRVVAVSQRHFGKVSLSFGRGLSQNGGRYFAAWQVTDNAYTTVGNIFSSHTEPAFNSPFLPPVNLDSLDQSTINKCRNPLIVCQQDDMDNDSSGITEIVIFEKQIPATNSFELLSFRNKKAATSMTFSPFTITSSPTQMSQTKLCYNPYDSTFMLTYYDPVNAMLPFLKNNVNLNDPDNWPVVSPGYNDNTNISDPNPQIELNYAMQQGFNGWIGGQAGEKGIALFDAPYHFLTDVDDKGFNVDLDDLSIYPVPCASNLNVVFHSLIDQTVDIRVYNGLGNLVSQTDRKVNNHDKTTVILDLTQCMPGLYYIRITSANSLITKKVIKLF
jgi:hypothetical protein